jgi:ABC-type cobalt transport system substrate-binding protein
MWLFIGIVVVVIIIIVLFVVGSRNSGLEEENYGLDDNQYREYVYHSVPKDFKPYLQQILNDIDEIKALERRNSLELSQASYNAMLEVYNKADVVEKKIKEYWNSSKFNKDFSYYIGLHYASHLLGNAVKQEQQIIKNSFVKCKNEQKKWADQIENLKYRQQRVSGKQKSDISQEIGNCCKAHKRISTLASQIGAINTQYNQRVSQQHMETAKRRDYIASNFGERGRRWKERMHQRALLRKGQNR